MRERKRIWTLMYKKSGEYKLWRYEPLRKKDIAAHEKHGWKVIK